MSTAAAFIPYLSEPQDKWGNRFNNIDMAKVLTADELRMAQAVLDKVHDLEHPKTEQEISSSVGKQKVTELEEDDPYLIDNSVVTVDRYNYTIDFNTRLISIGLLKYALQEKWKNI